MRRPGSYRPLQPDSAERLRARQAQGSPAAAASSRSRRRPSRLFPSPPARDPALGAAEARPDSTQGPPAAARPPPAAPRAPTAGENGAARAARRARRSASLRAKSAPGTAGRPRYGTAGGETKPGQGAGRPCRGGSPRRPT